MRNPCKHPRKAVRELSGYLEPEVRIEWCAECGATRRVRSTYNGHWKTPKAALDAQDLREELEDIKDAHTATINEECLESDDRKHCACVPFLRAEIDKLNAEREVAGVCRLCEQCHVYVCEEEPCELMPTLGDDGLLKCPNFKVVY